MPFRHRGRDSTVLRYRMPAALPGARNVPVRSPLARHFWACFRGLLSYRVKAARWSPPVRVCSPAGTQAATAAVPAPMPPMVAPQAASPTRPTRPVDQAGTSARLIGSKYGFGGLAREANRRGTSRPRPENAPATSRFCCSGS
ncbi:hypothetical protein GCM10010129_09990 [Streptomyces fumigatiscleroticus]|nr:hypothetical protein GCM10010129_09990 [Streptomyces fumigatiscleroticus]